MPDADATGMEMALQLLSDYPGQEDLAEAMVCVSIDHGQTLDQAVQTAREALVALKKPEQPKRMSAGKRLWVYECPSCGGEAYNGGKNVDGEWAQYRGGARCIECDHNFSVVAPGSPKPIRKDGPALMSALGSVQLPEKIKTASKPLHIHPRVAGRPDSVWEKYHGPKNSDGMWEKYHGPKGGSGWRNQYGEVLYQEKRPHGKHQGIPEKHAKYIEGKFIEGIDQGVVGRFRDKIEQLDKSVKELVNAAKMGEAKRGWYADATKAISQIFGTDAPRFAAVLAAQSPRQPVNKNLEMAVDTYEAWIEAGRPGVDDIVDIKVPKQLYDKSHNPILDADGNEMFARDESGNIINHTVKGFEFLKSIGGAVMGGRLPNTMRALTASDEVLASDKVFSENSHKVEPFRHNLLGDEDRVTLDTWMQQVFAVGEEVFGNKYGYKAGEIATRKAAAELGWTPAEVQETVWSVFGEMARLSKFGLDPKQIAEAVTHEGVAGISDFATQLLGDEDVVEQLRRCGFGEEIDAYRRAEQHREAALHGRAETSDTELSEKSAKKASKLGDMVKEKGVSPYIERSLADSLIDSDEVVYDVGDDKPVKGGDLEQVRLGKEITVPESEMNGGRVRAFLETNKDVVSRKSTASGGVYVRARKTGDGNVRVSFVRELSVNQIGISDIPDLIRRNQFGQLPDHVLQMAIASLDVPIVMKMADNHAPAGGETDDGKTYKGGQFTPSARSGRSAVEIRKEISQHKKSIKDQGIQISSFMNRHPSVESHRANQHLAVLKMELEKSTGKGKANSEHVKKFLKLHDADFASFGPQTKRAVVDKFNEEHKTNLTLEEFGELAGDNNKQMSSIQLSNLPALVLENQSGQLPDHVLQMAIASLDVPVVIEMDATHAPKGFNKQKPLDIAGKKFVGGEFIPGDVLAKASPEQKKMIEGKSGKSGSPAAPQTQATPKASKQAPLGQPQEKSASKIDPAEHPISREPTTPPPPGDAYRPNVEAKYNDGVTGMARVGVPAMQVPPPPRVGRLPNLTEQERRVESEFIKFFEANPDKMAQDYLTKVMKETKEGDPVTFETDGAKYLAGAWSVEDLAKRSYNRATLNLPLHQTANAITKRAFVKHLDTLKKGDQLLVTVGGCGAGKGFCLSNVPETVALKKTCKAVWDSAGDQNATENPWIQQEAEKRGLKVNYVFVHADPKFQWADPGRGVIKRAADPKDGRMVDALVFSDSYAIGAKNHQAFYEHHKNNPNANFVFLATGAKPKLVDGIPPEALNIDRHELAKFAVDAVAKSDAPEWVKRGGTAGVRIWGKKDA